MNTKFKRKSSPTDGEMSIFEHLAELRMRIVRSLLAVAIGAAAILIFYEFVLGILIAPYERTCELNPGFNCDGSLYALGPVEGLSARMRISGYGGLIMALPVVMWQLWRFIVPALSPKEKKYSVPFILSSVVLFLLGGYMAYWTLDKALEFLIAWSGEDVNQTYQISKYISLVALMVLAFGIGFLSPVLIVFLQLVGVITPQTLLRQWRVAVMIIFALAAVITPSGDPISMIALAGPMSLLYLVSVLIGFIAQRRSRKREGSIGDTD
jgi:sec-independent protein translocase protein TatC